MAEVDDEADQVPPSVRDDVLERDRHECQLCGVRGPGGGGVAALEVHHKMDNPDTCKRHDPENLTTLCVDCHSWAHKRPTGEDVPVTITDADRKVLLPHDYQILQILRRAGPLPTGEIQEALSLDLSALAVRERLYLMMGLDHEVESREEPLVDQDAMTGEWGLPEQIAESERGRIPDDMQVLSRRINDERVRRALARGCDRETVSEAFGIARRTTWHKQRRAQAYEFPLDAFDGSGSGPRRAAQTDRTAADNASDEAGESGGKDGSDAGDRNEGSEQVPLNTVPGQADDDDKARGRAVDETSDMGGHAREDDVRANMTAAVSGESQGDEDGEGDSEVQLHQADQDGAVDAAMSDGRYNNQSGQMLTAEITALQAKLDRVIAVLDKSDELPDSSTH